MDVLPEKAATALEDRADSEEHKRRNKAFLSHWPKRRGGSPPRILRGWDAAPPPKARPVEAGPSLAGERAAWAAYVPRPAAR